MKKWKNLWKIKHWPKVSFFVWTMLHGRALTWDQIQRKARQGPSRCTLCNSREETMEHLMNRCVVKNILWESHGKLFERCNRNYQNIINSIENWPRKPYQNPVINRAWLLSAGFLIWNIWKARNSVIFKAENRARADIWEQTLRNMRETILMESWKDEDWQVSPL